MTNQPPVPGAGDPAQPPVQPPVPPPPGPPPGFPPPQAPPTAPMPQQPQNPYPPAPPASQPVWQGHQAPQQGWGAYADPTPPKRSRKGLWIALGSVLVLALIAGAVLLAWVLLGGDDDEVEAGLEVSELKAGQCLTSDSLKDGEFDEITGLTDVDCDDEHDVEVFAMLELEDDESLGDVGARCVIEASDEGRPQFELTEDDLEIRPLVGSEEPEEGDDVACFVRHQEGERQSGSAFDDRDSEEEDE